MDWSAVISRWAHVGSAIILLGGSVFMLYILAPSSDGLSDTEHQALRERLLARWRKLVNILVALIFISGCYNFYLRGFAYPAERPWHAVAGIKLLLGLFVLFMASALVGKAKPFERFRQNWKYWLQINIIVAFIAVMISGYLKFLPAKVIAE